MKIAVIGATGMLGHHTAKAVIEAGHQLLVCHRKSSNLDQISDLQFESRICDLTVPETIGDALQGADAVINCAGYYPGKPRPWKEDVELALTQMSAFYDGCRKVNLKKIVYVGGAIALPLAGKGKLGDADSDYGSEPANKNNYLQVKWALDNQARQQAKSGLPVVIGIPAMTFGEYDYGPTTGRLIVEVANQTIPGYVKGMRNVVYAGDAGRGLMLVCEKGRVGERYILGGDNISMDELVPLICDLAGAPVPQVIPLAVAKTVAKVQGLKYRLLGGDPPKLDKTAIAVLSLGQYLDYQKSIDELGYRPNVSAGEAVERAFNWFREVGYIQPAQ